MRRRARPGSCGTVLSSSSAVWRRRRQLCRDGERAGTHLEARTAPSLILPRSPRRSCAVVVVRGAWSVVVVVVVVIWSSVVVVVAIRQRGPIGLR